MVKANQARSFLSFKQLAHEEPTHLDSGLPALTLSAAPARFLSSEHSCTPLPRHRPEVTVPRSSSVCFLPILYRETHRLCYLEKSVHFHITIYSSTGVRSAI